MSKVYSLKTVQKIPAKLETTWEFFSNPSKLKDITPAKLNFNIISQNQTEMYAGQIIEYTVSPLLGIPLYWMTEITHVENKKYFTDEQRFGPYTFWYHQHHFKEIEGGVEMTDLLHYKIPFWFIGDIANSLLIKKELRNIFEYRHKIVEEHFGTWKDQKCEIIFY